VLTNSRVRSGLASRPSGRPWRDKPHCGSIRVDETYIKIRGQWRYLYRAIDKHGNPVDFLLTVKRDLEAAKRFFRKALKDQPLLSPDRIGTDGAGAYPPAIAAARKDGLLARTPGHAVAEHAVWRAFVVRVLRDDRTRSFVVKKAPHAPTWRRSMPGSRTSPSHGRHGRRPSAALCSASLACRDACRKSEAAMPFVCVMQPAREFLGAAGAKQRRTQMTEKAGKPQGATDDPFADFEWDGTEPEPAGESYSAAEVEAVENDPGLRAVLQMLEASDAETGDARLEMIRLAMRHARKVGLSTPPSPELMAELTAGLPVKRYYGTN
jgi:hypothetical protein